MLSNVTSRYEGGRYLIDLTTEDGDTHRVDEDAVASWSELLGFSDVIDTLEAIVTVRVYGEPEPDPTTGENAWTAGFTILEHRERARSAEAEKAVAEGRRDDPRSPKLRAALAARKAVMDATRATRDRECLLEKVRGGSRSGLKGKRPKKARTAGRISNPTCETETQTDGEGIFTQADRELIHVELAMLADHIGWRRGRFLHDLSGAEKDLLYEEEPGGMEGEATEDDTAAPEPDPTTLDGLITRHGGAA